MQQSRVQAILASTASSCARNQQGLVQRRSTQGEHTDTKRRKISLNRLRQEFIPSQCGERSRPTLTTLLRHAAPVPSR